MWNSGSSNAACTSNTSRYPVTSSFFGAVAGGFATARITTGRTLFTVLVLALILLMSALIALNAACSTAAERKPYTRNVAIVVYENAEPLDWTGPFEVYNDAGQFGAVRGENAFNVYLVSKTKDPVNAQGLHVVPQYSIADAPKPDIVLFPGGPSGKVYDDPEFFAWAKQASLEAEIAQSV